MEKSLVKKSKKAGIDCPVLLVPMEYRRMFFSLLSLYMNNIVVLAHEELSCNAKVEIVGEI